MSQLSREALDRMLAPMVMSTSTLRYAKGIFDAGISTGRALGRKVPWWRDNERELAELRAGYAEYERALGSLDDYIEAEVDKAYRAGLERGRSS